MPFWPVNWECGAWEPRPPVAAWPLQGSSWPLAAFGVGLCLPVHCLSFSPAPSVPSGRQNCLPYPLTSGWVEMMESFGRKPWAGRQQGGTIKSPGSFFAGYPGLAVWNAPPARFWSPLTHFVLQGKAV